MKTFSRTTRKNIAAVLFGPLLLLPAMLLTFVGLSVINHGSIHWQEVIEIHVFICLLGLMVAYPATLLLGVPSVLILKRLNRLGYFSVLLAAIAWSVLIAVALGMIGGSLFAAYCGSIVASGYWLVYRHVKIQ